jgi:ubiquinone/menaquinone biosynthesis C-methylase UbiE
MSGIGIDKNDPSYPGTRLYGRWFLPFYDAILYSCNSRVFWRCPKQKIVARYNCHISGRHLDVGVGSGSVLDQTQFPTSEPEITLLDVNAVCLGAAARRLQRYSPRVIQGDALDPWPVPDDYFSSVSINHLLHCLPGSMLDKAGVIDEASRALSPGGTVFGATILGDPALHTFLSQRVLRAANRKGALSNEDDRASDLKELLSRSLKDVNLEISGSVALFSARKGSGQL